MFDLISLLWDIHTAIEAANGRDVQRLKSSATDAPLKAVVEQMATMVITPDIFAELQNNLQAKEIFRDLDVADEDQFNLFELLDVDESGTLELEELVEGVSKLRGDARRSDIIAVELLLRKLLQDTRSQS